MYVSSYLQHGTTTNFLPQSISGNRLFQFIADARQFVVYFRDGIENAPLQIYYSGVMFSPEASIVPQPLADRQCPDWIAQPPEVESNWPQSLHTVRDSREPILQMTFTSNSRLVSRSVGGQINIWDTESGSCLPVVSNNAYPSWADCPFATWREDRIAMPFSNSIGIWDAKTGIHRQKVVIEDHEIDQVAFTDDGKYICSVSKRLLPNLEYDNSGLNGQDSKQGYKKRSEENFVHIHNLSTGECVRKFGCGVDWLDFRFSPKGQWITSLGMTLAKWDPYNDLHFVELESGRRHMILGFSADGTLLASMRSYPAIPLEIKIWCIESTECLYTHRIHDQGTGLRMYQSLALTKDLLVYESKNGDAVFVWLAAGKISRRPDIRVKGRLAISLDGKTLATQLSWGVIQIWDLTSVSLASPPNLHSGPVECVAPIADENTILSSTSQEVKIWDISTGQCKETHQQVTFRYDAKFPLATATNAPLYATWSKDHIEIWHLDPTNGIKQLPLDYGTLTGLVDVTVSANGERLAAILCDDDDHAQCALKIWDVKSATLLQELYYDLDTKAIAFNGLKLAISPDGTRVVYNTLTTTEFRDVSTPHSPAIQLLTYPRSGYHISQVTFHNDRIFAVTDDKHLHTFDHKTGEEIGKRILDEQIAWSGWDKSFINIEAIYGTSNGRTQPISDLTKPYYIFKRDHWLHKKGDNLLWLPADYVPHSACVVGSTVVIGTVSGRVLFLYLKDQD
jgi:hypothetical protein